MELTPEDLKRCTQILETLTGDRARLNQMTEEERKALLMAAGRLSRPERYEIMKLTKKYRRTKKRKILMKDRATVATTDIRANRLAPVYVAPAQITDVPGTQSARILERARHCYVCKVEYRELHFFYDSMCPPCADLNYRKRFQTASLEGKVAVITGSRLKIGYQSALMMLRAGAKVIATTRFPHDSALRYAKEPDYAIWKHRLHIHGLDLRHAPSVELFSHYLNDSLDRLDILINNAAQTVRRPTGFYKHMLEKEAMPITHLPPDVQPLLLQHEDFKSALSGSLRLPPMPGTGDASWIAEWHDSGGSAGIGIHSSAALSQVPWTNEDMVTGKEVFPVGLTDADLQQVDLRKKNSWRLTLAEVPTPEMIEVQLVNSISPFILCGKLKPLMLRHRTFDKHVVNVSAMEGKFARHTKTDKHPHTNMAKAALNMMTLTSAPDYAKDGIYMNAVDTGWVTDEDPAHLSAAKQAEHDFQPPLDIVDGAARVCDPFFSGLLTGEHVWGKFLKDYFPTAW